MSVLGLLLLLINNILDGITLFKIFAGNTSLFSKVHDIDISAKELHSEIQKIVNQLSNEKYILILIPMNKQKKFFSKELLYFTLLSSACYFQ